MDDSTLWRIWFALTISGAIAIVVLQMCGILVD